MKDRISQGFTFLKDRFVPREEMANRQAITDNIKLGIEFRGAKVLSLVFTVLLACTGIITDSIPVMLGALIISPLSGPAAGLSAGAAISSFDMLIASVRNLLFIMAVTVFVSFICFFFIPGGDRTSWALHATPTIWDVMISFLAGLASVLSGNGRRNGFVIAGAAVATCLLFPLCAAGYYLAQGNGFFMGAIGLFAVNVLFIGAGGFLVLKIAGFRSQFATPRLKNISLAFRITAGILLLSVVVSLWSREIFKHRAHKFISHEISGKDVFVIAKKIEPAHARIWLAVYGNKLSDTAITRITTNKRFYGLHEADVRITYSESNIMHPDSLNIIKEQAGEYNDRVVALNENELMSRQYKMSLSQFDFKKTNPEVYSEFNSLFGETKELSIEQAWVLNENNEKDTVVLVYLRQPAGAVKPNIKQVERWVKNRFGVQEVRMMIR